MNKSIIGSFFFSLVISNIANAALLEEVVVTAQKREQSLQDVSVSVTAFDGESLNRLGITNTSEVFAAVPNAIIHLETNAPTINIRGVRLNDYGDGNESPISLYVDEIYHSTLGAMDSGLFDVERVEVLRGPQGTLFGRNSTGGLIHVVSRKPTEEFEASGSAQYGSYDERILEGAVSGPLSDKIRGRIAAKYQEDDGWQENLATGRDDFGSTDSLAFRGMLDVDFTGNLNALFSVHHSDLERNVAQPNSFGGLEPTAPFIPLVIPGIGTIPGVFIPNKCPTANALAGQCLNGWSFALEGDTKSDVFRSNLEEMPYDSKSTGGSVKLIWNLGNAMELVSITGYEYYDRSVEWDLDGSTAQALRVIYASETDQWTQEIHLSGATDKLNWIIGGFYLTDQKDNLFTIPELIAQDMTTLGRNSIADLDTESWAVFGQADFSLTEQITLVGGLRYTDETKKLNITDSLTAPNFTDNEKLSAGNVTWKAGIEWRPTEEHMLYFNATRGFKSGTFNTTLVVQGTSAPVAEETVTTYEAGFKGDFLDGVLRTSGAIFYSDYENVQSVNDFIQNNLPVNLLINVPSADIYGAELEATITPSDYFQLIFSIGLLDTEINAPGLSFMGVTVDGNNLPASPDVNFNIMGIIDLPIPEHMGAVSLQTRYAWQDDIVYSFIGTETTAQEAYGLLDFNLRWDVPGDQYYVEAFVKNATDKEYATGAFDLTLNINRTVNTPRWAGIKAGFNF